MFAERRGIEWSAFEVVATQRQADAHKIAADNTQTKDYYPRRFRDELEKLTAELNKLAAKSLQNNLSLKFARCLSCR
jgi:hypothetical protein